MTQAWRTVHRCVWFLFDLVEPQQEFFLQSQVDGMRISECFILLFLNLGEQ
jgi:hypothetical protein